MELTHALTRAAEGDRSAQDHLIATYYARVRAMVHRRLETDFRRRHRWMLAVFSTGDIVQDVFVGVVRHLQATDIEDEEAFVRYLATLVRHRIMDTVRHHEADRRDNRRHVDPAAGVERESEDDTPQVEASVLEQVRIVQDVMRAFDERDRTLLELRLNDEHSFPEIADALGFGTPKAARTAYVRAHARLLVELRQRGLSGDATLG